MNYRRSHRIKRKKSKLKKVLFLLSLFSSFCLFVYFLFISDFFVLKKIIISGNIKTAQEDLLVEIQKEVLIKKFQIIDNNLLLLDSDAIKNNILSSFHLVSHVEIIKKFPSTISILIDERIGVAVFCDSFNEEVSEKCFITDNQGFLFEEFLEEDQLLPKIRSTNLQKSLILGTQIMEEKLLSTILDFHLGMKNINVQLREFLIIADNRINIMTKDGWEIYFNPKENTEWQLTKLSAVLSEGISLEERKELEYIELRFGNTAPFKKKN